MFTNCVLYSNLQAALPVNVSGHLALHVHSWQGDCLGPHASGSLRASCVQDTVNFPVHLKNFNLSQLRQVCKELRSDIVHTVSKTGGEHSTDKVSRSAQCLRLYQNVNASSGCPHLC